LYKKIKTLINRENRFLRKKKQNKNWNILNLFNIIYLYV
jgi:hypothetical protein